jgi:hypothetical protein
MHINKKKAVKSKAPYKEVYVTYTTKSNAGIEYEHYKKAIISNS